MTGEELYARWARIWAEMLTFVTGWDDLNDDERNAWATLAEQLRAERPPPDEPPGRYPADRE